MTENLGRLFENLVFLELLKRGYDLKTYELFYYRSRNDKETDFVCRKGTKIEQLIQVCYDMSSAKTRKRETDSLLECARELRCKNLSIITWDEEGTIEDETDIINIIPLRKWIQR